MIYHPTNPDPRNDWTFIGLRSKEEMQVRQELKRVQDWRSQMENQQVFKTDTCDGLRKNLGFSSDSCFFERSVFSFQIGFSRCVKLLQGCLSRILATQMTCHLPDLRDRSIDAEWLFNMPAFLIVDPVVCEWNLTSSSPLGNSITQSTEIRMTEPKKS